MSHPDPHYDPENSYPRDPDDMNIRGKKKKIASKIGKRMNDGKAPKSNLKTIKAMISQPASKEWFAKYGLPRGDK